MTASESEKVSGSEADSRLSSLDERLQAAHIAEAERTAPIVAGAGFTGKGASQGNRVLSTLIGTPLGASIIGWLADRWFGTAPVIMLSMMFIGIVAAFVQIFRISRERAE